MRRVSQVVRNKAMLPVDYIPGTFDVICSRGFEAHQHNTKFRATIQMHLSRYSIAPNETVDKVIDAVRQRGVGFIRKDPLTNLYFEVGDFHAKRKVVKAFKEVVQKESRRKRSRYSMSSSMITEPSLSLESCFDEADDEIVAPAPPLFYQSSFGSSASFCPTQFSMAKSGGDLLDDSDCSDVEHFFDIQRRPTSCLIEEDCEEPL